eukprot:COSAG05_NODE_1095_length_5901_cov_26.506205_2_plen_255_part_00
MHRPALRFSRSAPTRLGVALRCRHSHSWPDVVSQRVPLPWSPGARGEDDSSGETTRQRKISNAIEQQLRKTLLAGDWSKQATANQAQSLQEVFASVELDAVTVNGDLSVATVCWRPADAAASPTRGSVPSAAGRKSGRRKDEPDQKFVKRMLQQAAGMLRRPVGRALAMRRVPQLKFKYETSSVIADRAPASSPKGVASGIPAARQKRRAQRKTLPVSSLSEAFERIAAEEPLIRVVVDDGEEEIPERGATNVT